MIKVKEL